VLLGLSFSSLGETRLGIAKGPAGLQVRVWAEHPELLEASRAAVEGELNDLGDRFDLKIMPLIPGPGGAIPRCAASSPGPLWRPWVDAPGPGGVGWVEPPTGKATAMEQDRQRLASKLNIGKEIWYMTQKQVVAAGLTETDILALTGRPSSPMAQRIRDARQDRRAPVPEVFFHAMPAYVPSRHALGMKWIECYPNNPAKFDLPQTTGLLLLNDIQSGCPVAIMDCAWITAMRTPP